MKKLFEKFINFLKRIKGAMSSAEKLKELAESIIFNWHIWLFIAADSYPVISESFKGKEEGLHVFSAMNAVIFDITAFMLLSSLILKIYFGVIDFFNGKVEQGNLVKRIAAFAIYVLSLRLIYTQFPRIWEAWNNPAELFWITNVIVVIVLFAFKESWKLAVSAMVAIIFLNFSYPSSTSAAKKDELSKEMKEFMKDLSQSGNKADNSTKKTEKVPTALVLMQEGWTPLTVDIEYAFHIQTDGEPINVKLQGIRDPVAYSGKGEINVPPNYLSGNAVITSNNENKPSVWAKVFKVVEIKEGV